MSTRWTIETHDTVTSTMDLARKRARAGAADGLVVVAEEQTGGRGRRGNRWESPQGGLWLTVLLRSPDALDPLVTVAGALAAADACSRSTGVDVRIKWPNDLYAGGAKLGGVMAEAASRTVLLGIGINANVSAGRLPSVEYYRTTSLALEAGSPVGLVELRETLLEELEVRLAMVSSGDPGVVEEWRARSLELGRRVVASRGAETFQGVATAIRDDGGLVLDVSGERVVLMPHGDVTLGLLGKAGAEG